MSKEEDENYEQMDVNENSVSFHEFDAHTDHATRASI